MSPASPDSLSALQVECLSKLVPVRFGLYSSTDRIVSKVRSMRTATPNEAMALYKICWRYRAQINDWKFIARVMIAKALLEESLDLAEIVDNRVYARAWRAPPQRELEV